MTCTKYGKWSYLDVAGFMEKFTKATCPIIMNYKVVKSDKYCVDVVHYKMTVFTNIDANCMITLGG